uniref:Uncharacterized protein n=1 Tax=Monopterus albus TaxID=43700 RepID=A0A3Q3IKJ7_MONAL
VIPFSIVDFPVNGLGLGVPVQHLNGKKIHLRAWVLALLLSGFTMAEKHQPIGFCGPEVERDGSCLLRCPLAQCHIRLWGVKGHGV